MQILATDETSLERSLSAAVATLRAGGLVAFPTETVYGLGADARNETAIRRIFAAKGRPAAHPVIVHVSDVDQIGGWATEVPAAAWRVARHFWPGPLTVILKKAPRTSLLLSGGATTIGLRVPAHPVAQRLLQQFGSGIAAPSANRFSRVSPTSARDVADDLGDAVDVILDGGRCPVGVESTIVDFSQAPPVLLRPGALTLEMLCAAAGVEIVEVNRAETASPGQHAVHYAPRAKVHICSGPEELLETVVRERSSGRRAVVLAWQPWRPEYGEVEWWEWPADLEQAAFELFHRLREIDRRGFDTAIVEMPSDQGLGKAIGDRLRRAGGLG